MSRHVQPTAPKIVSAKEELLAGFNPTHNKLLHEGAAVWNHWREQNPSEWPMLMGADLRGLNLSGFDLHFGSFQNANFENVDLSDSWLSSAHFEQANLSGAKLNSAFAEWACFTAADMVNSFAIDANFKKANFQQANARGAHLSSAIFEGAILPSADLRDTYLVGTNFTGAWLDGANLSAAELGQTYFVDCDLSYGIGLESCRHSSHSYIDFRTLQQCRRHLPGVFLKGCGLSDVVIDYIPSLFDSAINYYSCFLSHSHADKEFAQYLYARLQEHEIRCWLDDYQMLPGDDPHERIQQGIRVWDKFILCASKSSLTSWWVDSELNRAFAKEQTLTRERGHKVRLVIPLDLDGFLFSDSWKSGKKEEVHSRMVGDFKNWSAEPIKFEFEFDRLIKALRADDAAREIPPQPKI